MCSFTSINPLLLLWQFYYFSGYRKHDLCWVSASKSQEKNTVSLNILFDLLSSQSPLWSHPVFSHICVFWADLRLTLSFFIFVYTPTEGTATRKVLFCFKVHVLQQIPPKIEHVLPNKWHFGMTAVGISQQYWMLLKGLHTLPGVRRKKKLS